MVLPKLTLVLGGAASGKSAYAESIVLGSGHEAVYVATAQVFDDEMAAKVQRHRDMRADGWYTVEEPLAIATLIDGLTIDQAVLVDCATLWLTNLMLGEHDIDRAVTGLLATLKRGMPPVVIVSNEVGEGIVPENRLSRQFRDAQGMLNQRLAAQADTVVKVTAGLPVALKGQLP